MKIRKARVADVQTIHGLINGFAKRKKIIPRSLNDIYENVRDFFVFENRGAVKGACALHVMWEDLAEIRSLVVDRRSQGKGVGRALVERAIEEARELGISSLFTLTYMPEYFRKLGFEDIDKSKLPQKVWGECIKCPHFPGCDELALILKL